MILVFGYLGLLSLDHMEYVDKTTATLRMNFDVNCPFNFIKRQCQSKFLPGSDDACNSLKLKTQLKIGKRKILFLKLGSGTFIFC